MHTYMQMYVCLKCTYTYVDVYVSKIYIHMCRYTYMHIYELTFLEWYIYTKSRWWFPLGDFQYYPFMVFETFYHIHLMIYNNYKLKYKVLIAITITDQIKLKMNICKWWNATIC